MDLREPDAGLLADYVAALGRGWSSNSTRNTAEEELTEIRADPKAYLHRQRTSTGPIGRPDGSTIERLPGLIRWIWQDGFCGSINFRHLPGADDLPPHVSGHVGYSVVSWRRGEGIATAALIAFLPLIRAHGAGRIKLTCDTGNALSSRVIEAAGGIEGAGEQFGDADKRVFWINL
jgi:predicted acetyltransferase